MSNTQGSSRLVESDRGPDKGEAYGVAGVTQKLKGLHFPVSKDELLREHGNETIQWTKAGESFKLKDCLGKVGKTEFQSITEITAAISDAVH